MGSNLNILSIQQPLTFQQQQSYFKHFKNDQDFNKKLTFYKVQNHIKIYHLKQFFISEIKQQFSSKTQLFNKLKILTALKQINQYIPTIYHYQIQQPSFCNNAFSLTTYMNYHNFTLDQYLNQKLKNQNLLNNGQIWYILKTLSSLGNILKNKKIRIKCFDKKKIWICATFEIKMNIQDLVLQRQFQNLINDQYLFLPPQLLNQKRVYKKQYDYKCQIFSLGMLILQIYTGLDSLVSYYRKNQKNLMEIDIKRLNDDIKEISDKYLASILSRMLQVNPQRRVFYEQLLQLIKICQNYVDIEDCLNIN